MIFVRPPENLFAGGCPPDRKSCVQGVRLPQKVGDPQGLTSLAAAPNAPPPNALGKKPTANDPSLLGPFLHPGTLFTLAPDHYGTIETEI